MKRVSKVGFAVGVGCTNVAPVHGIKMRAKVSLDKIKVRLNQLPKESEKSLTKSDDPQLKKEVQMIWSDFETLQEESRFSLSLDGEPAAESMLKQIRCFSKCEYRYPDLDRVAQGYVRGKGGNQDNWDAFVKHIQKLYKGLFRQSRQDKYKFAEIVSTVNPAYMSISQQRFNDIVQKNLDEKMEKQEKEQKIKEFKQESLSQSGASTNVSVNGSKNSVKCNLKAIQLFPSQKYKKKEMADIKEKIGKGAFKDRKGLEKSMSAMGITKNEHGDAWNELETIFIQDLITRGLISSLDKLRKMMSDAGINGKKSRQFLVTCWWKAAIKLWAPFAYNLDMRTDDDLKKIRDIAMAVYKERLSNQLTKEQGDDIMTSIYLNKRCVEKAWTILNAHVEEAKAEMLKKLKQQE